MSAFDIPKFFDKGLKDKILDADNPYMVADEDIMYDTAEKLPDLDDIGKDLEIDGVKYNFSDKKNSNTNTLNQNTEN